MTRPALRVLLLSALVAALSACGFQLRDALVLPPDLDPVMVKSPDRYSPLADSLAQSLARAGAVPAGPGEPAPAVLDILAERWGDTPISVDSRGRAQEFSLRYAVVFELRNGDGSELVPQQSIELSRDYISVPSDAIGTEGERDILVRELRREMSAAVLRRIGAAGRGGRMIGPDPFAGTTDAAQAAMDAAAALAPPPEAEDEPETAPEPEPVRAPVADPEPEDDGSGGDPATVPAG
ncbi:LPS assembly lipoprotein LptE [Lysobacter sp. GX 14042]|uniref:LPS-assembly lipoprotein LptE n=1 Tax=Lysobacter sp. GX 14042 TaxID=2907155 RepID=UPI001F16DDE4|nr:LPS assembly lipoprotein LptE [Lysobacter sp. GX 14042]MCE7033140.1 LPS assembly lipoprotein LptE [Lysobacter sp. GX 14042]